MMQRTKDLVKDVRNLSDKNGVDLLVTGSTAVNIDISDRLNDAIPVFAVLIVGFAFVPLTIVFVRRWCRLLRLQVSY